MRHTFILFTILFMFSSSLANASVKYNCSLVGLVYEKNILVTFTDPIKREIVLEESSGGFQSKSEIILEKAGLTVRIAIGSYKGHTDMTMYVYDSKGELIANVAGLSEDRSGKIAEFVGAHAFNRDAPVSSLTCECGLAP